MKMNLKRKISGFLVALMLVNLFAGTMNVAAKGAKLKAGSTFTSGQYVYKVLGLSGKNGTVSLVGARSKSIATVKIPETVKSGKYRFQVTAIANNAFKGCKKLKKVTTNKSLQTIGKNAFSGCKQLQKIHIKGGSLNSVGKNALKGISKKAVIQVPKNVKDVYAGLLKNKGQSAKVRMAGVGVASVPAPAAPQANTQVTASQPQTEAPKQTETEAPQQTETEAPKQTETEVQPQTETETEAPKQTEAPQQTETEAPKQTETEVQPQTETETDTPEQTETEKSEAEMTPEELYAICEKEGHDFSSEDPELVKRTPPTCTSNGTINITCRRCKKAIRSTSYCGPLPHTYETHKTDPTCVKAGVSYDACTVCGKKINETTIPALGHDYVMHREEPTCKAYGLSYEECSRCGTKRGSTEYIPKKDHVWKTERKEPTCTESGYEAKVCENCGTRSEMPLSKTAHELVEFGHKDASCTEDGGTVLKCEHCDYTELVVTERAKGHQMRCVERKAASCAPGYEKWECAVCDYGYEKTLPATGEHHWTLNEDRRGIKDCWVCGMSYEDYLNSKAG